MTVIVLGNNDTVSAPNIGRDIGAIYYGQPYTVPVERR